MLHQQRWKTRAPRYPLNLAGRRNAQTGPTKAFEVTGPRRLCQAHVQVTLQLTGEDRLAIDPE